MNAKVPYLLEVRPKGKNRKKDAYPFHIPSFHGGDIHISFSSPVTFFVGENGSGKSTLLEAIAISGGFNPGGGSKNTLNEQRRSESELHDHLILSWRKKPFDGFFLRAESFFNFATFLEDWERDTGINFHAPYGGKSLHEQSHGESFLALMKNRFKKGIFLLDEPEAALSPVRQLTFLSLLHSLIKNGESQFIIATHSPILLSYPGATILQFNEKGIQAALYEETEHFKVTKDFLDNQNLFFRYLFGE